MNEKISRFFCFKGMTVVVYSMVFVKDFWYEKKGIFI